MNIDLYDLRRREVQALGAALSCRDWHMMEKAYNSLRDKLDNAGFTVSGPPATPKPHAGGDAGEPAGALIVCDQTGGRMFTAWPVTQYKKWDADSLYGDTGGYRIVPLYAALALPAPVVEGEIASTLHDCSRALRGMEIAWSSMTTAAPEHAQQHEAMASQYRALADRCDAALSEGRSHG